MTENVATVPTVDIDALIRKRKDPRLEAIVFADYAVVGRDGKTTVAAIFDRVFADPEKRKTGRFFLYIKTAETMDAPVGITISDPKGRLVATATGSVDSSAFEGEPPTGVAMIVPFSLRLGPQGIDGPYWFEVFYKEQSLGGSVLNVAFRKQEG